MWLNVWMAGNTGWSFVNMCHIWVS